MTDAAARLLKGAGSPHHRAGLGIRKAFGRIDIVAASASLQKGLGHSENDTQ